MISYSTYFVYSLAATMADCDIYPFHINPYNTDKFERFKSQNICHGSSKCCYYIIFPRQIGAEFGCWSRDIHRKWWAKSLNKISFEEKRLYKEQVERLKKEKEIKKLEAQFRIQKIWNESQEANCDHPYLIKKKIRPLYIRQYENNLIIPIFNQKGEMISLQYIHENGSKLYESGSSTQGGYFALGETLSSPIRLCEGYATGVSIYEAIGPSVVVCFSANNLREVTEWLFSLRPNVKIQICADDDYKTETRIGKNTGLSIAYEISQCYPVEIVYPDFSLLPNTDWATDFNDLQCLLGIEEVEHQLSNRFIPNKIKS